MPIRIRIPISIPSPLVHIPVHHLSTPPHAIFFYTEVDVQAEEQAAYRNTSLRPGAAGKPVLLPSHLPAEAEAEAAMIGTSRLEFVFIQVCIIGLHYLAPLCLLYCTLIAGLYGLRYVVESPLPLIVELLAGAEALFFLLVYLPNRYYLQREAVHPPTPRREQRKQLFYLCNDNIANPEAYLQKWFLGAELKDIKRENLKEFLLWAFFNRGGPPGDDDEELEEYVGATEKLLGRPIEIGTGKAKCLRLTLDRVDMLHRSLLWYFCVGFVDFLTCLKLLYHGFHFHRTALSQFFTLFPFRPISLLTTHRSPAKHITYWHRPHTSPTKPLVVFIHGIGIGLYPYTNFLAQLNSMSGLETANHEEQVGIIAIEVMPVSFRITHAALAKSEMCSEIEQILMKHLTPGQKCVLVSHSYGSVVTTHLLHTPSTAALIGPVVLIDPVTVLLHLPDVAYNFVRRQPKKANEHQLYYFASMDMGVSHTLSRNFFWNQSVLWKQDLEGRRVTVSLSGRDLIVDTEAVGRYLSKDRVVANEHLTANEYAISNEHATTNEHADIIGNRGRVLIEFEGRLDLQDPIMSVRGGDCHGDKETRSCSENGSSELKLDREGWKSQPWRGTGTDIIWFKELDHAQVFDRHATRQKIIDAIFTYCNGE